MKKEKTFAPKKKGKNMQFSKVPKKGKKMRRKIRLSRLKFEEKILQIKRVTKVVKGGKKMTFRAVVIVGDINRKVGLGVGRADDVKLAIDKAVLNAKKHIINVPLTKKSSIPHFTSFNFGACKIIMKPAPLGTGVIAGASMRPVLELSGIKNVSAKQLGAKNILNNAKATIMALSTLAKKIELTSSQSARRKKFYDKIMKKFKSRDIKKSYRKKIRKANNA